MYHLNVAPKVIIISGSIFMVIGIMVNVDEIGLIHDMKLPDIVAMRARIVIGLMILYSSDSMIRGDELELDHMVTKLNRME